MLWKKRRSIPLSKITNIDVRQGPFERIFGYGKIWIFTPSTGSALPEEKLLGILKPHEIKQAIIDRTEAAKQPITMPTNGNAVESPKDIVLLLTDIRDSLHRIEASLTKNQA